MNLRELLLRLKQKYRQPSEADMARESYGREPYGSPAEVGVWERFEAAASNNVRYLLTYVLGTAAVIKLREDQYPYVFRQALPTTSAEIIQCAKQDGLPKWLARYSLPTGSGYWIHEDGNGAWITSEVDERNFRFDHHVASKWYAEKYVVDFYIRWTSNYWVDTYANKL